MSVDDDPHDSCATYRRIYGTFFNALQGKIHTRSLISFRQTALVSSKQYTIGLNISEALDLGLGFWDIEHAFF